MTLGYSSQYFQRLATLMKYGVGAQCCFWGELPCTSPFVWKCFILLNVLVVTFQLSEALETLYFIYIIVLQIKTSSSLQLILV